MTTLVDRVNARLDAWEAAAEEIETPWHQRCMKPFIEFGDISQCWLPRGHDDDCATAAATRRALPTIDADVVTGLHEALALHAPEYAYDGHPGWCASCGDGIEGADLWPCPTVVALAGAVGVAADEEGEG